MTKLFINRREFSIGATALFTMPVIPISNKRLPPMLLEQSNEPLLKLSVPKDDPLLGNCKLSDVLVFATACVLNINNNNHFI